MNQRSIFLAAGISGALAVGLGAFGAHALQDMLESANRLQTYETAVSYHFYHTLLLLALGLGYSSLHRKFASYAAIAVLIGLMLFCGSLYLLCLTGITRLGAVTPLGGLGFIAAWLLLARAAFSGKKS